MDKKLVTTMLGLLLLCSTFAGCQAEAERVPQAAGLEQSVVSLTLSTHRLNVPWGSDKSHLGLVPAGPDNPARGPMSVALTRTGDILVLDSVVGRVAVFDENTGALKRAFPVKGLPADVCGGADGSVATWEPTGTRLRTYDRNGLASGESALGPAFVTVTGLTCLHGKRLVSTRHQETFDAGSASPLASGREGIAGLDGEFYALRLAEESAHDGTSRVELWQGLEPKLEGAGVAARKIAVWPTNCSAVKLAGTTETGKLVIICDEVSAGEPVAVQRRIEVRSLDGSLLGSVAIPMGWEYQPFRWLSVGKDRFLTAIPGPHGLHLAVYMVREVAP